MPVTGESQITFMTLPNYMQREIEIPYSRDVLSGVLLRPSFSGQHPSIVLLPG